MAAISFKSIEKSLAGLKGDDISIPLGRPSDVQMKVLRQRFPEWDISIDPYDPFGAYVNFEKKEAAQ